MWYFISIGYYLQEYLKSSCEKNLRQYSPIEAWLTTAYEALVHNKLECLKTFNHNPSLI